MTYFISDTHFGHDKFFIYEKRGFKSIQEHDEMFIENFNKLVTANDVVYFLGDFTWKNPLDYFNRLNCKNWHLIKGNHDKGLHNALRSTNKILSYTEGYKEIKINEQYITLSHFPLLCWEGSHRNAWQLYGHLHGREIPIEGKLKEVDLCADHFRPYSYDEIVEIMNISPDNWDYLTM